MSNNYLSVIKLKSNFKLLFWIQALTEVKVINVISTIFYIHRGLTINQIFLTAIIFSAISLISEIPSSYLADKWGRKKLIIVATIFNLFFWIINLFAHNFLEFAFAFMFYGLANAFMSGTDEALIYDTNKALGEEGHSLKELGEYISAQRIFKIFTPIIAVLIASNLSEMGYILVLLIDVIANIIALTLCFFLTEPEHFHKVEKVEAGIFIDAFNLLSKNPVLMNMIFNRTLIFIASFIVWRVFSEYFVSIGIPVLILGTVVSANQLLTFLFNRYAHKIFKKGAVYKWITWLNFICVFSMILFFLCSVFELNKYLSLFFYSLFIILEVARWPLFSDIFNKASKSYNRATTLSLTSFVKSILDIPLLFLSSILSSFGYSYIFGFVCLIGIGTLIFFNLSTKKDKILSFQVN